MCEYYANRFLSGAPVLVRQDPAVNFDRGYGSPAPNIPVDNFSVRWTTSLFFPEGWIRFSARADDGMRLWVDGKLVIDQWHDFVNTLYVADLWLGSGNHTLVVDYYEHTQYAFIELWWEPISPTPSPGFPEWKGEYFANRHLEGAPTYVRNDYGIDLTGAPVHRRRGSPIPTTRCGGRVRSISTVGITGSTPAPMTVCASSWTTGWSLTRGTIRAATTPTPRTSI